MAHYVIVCRFVYVIINMMKNLHGEEPCRFYYVRKAGVADDRKATKIC